MRIKPGPRVARSFKITLNEYELRRIADAADRGNPACDGYPAEFVRLAKLALLAPVERRNGGKP